MFSFETEPLWSTAVITVFIQLVTYSIAVSFQFDTITDFSGGSNFILLAIFGIISRNTYFKRQIIITTMVLIWGVRLALFLFIRVLKRGRDERFDKIRINPIRFLIFFIIQMIWVWVVSLPVTLMNHQQIDVPISILDLIGWSFWVFGFLWEAISDQQKYNFNLNPENKSKVLNTGLWRYSRYPNYFGEILLWIGIFLSAVGSFDGDLMNILISSGSPLLTIVLLRFVSGVRLTEIRYNQRFGDREDWLQYKASTNLFIPGIPKQ
eukprot:gene3088-5258_t